jgi:competence protein ComEA
MFEDEESQFKINLTKFLKLPKLYLAAGVIFALGFGCLFYGLWSLARVSNSEKTSFIASTSDSPQEASRSSSLKKIYIDVGGAVQKPGIYALDQGSRVSAALEKASGFSNKASADYISSQLNLAKKLSDEEKIYIYSESEFKQQNQKSEVSVVSPNVTTNGNLISINNASQSELEGLDGVGEKRAADIIGGRPYSSIDDLLTKKILSQTIFEQNKIRLSL